MGDTHFTANDLTFPPAEHPHRCEEVTENLKLIIVFFRSHIPSFDCFTDQLDYLNLNSAAILVAPTSLQMTETKNLNRYRIGFFGSLISNFASEF